MNRAYPWRVKNKEETFCIEELGATWGAVQVPGKTSLHYVCTSESDRKNGDDFVTTREFVSNRIDEGDRFQVENSQRETFESIIGSQFDNGCGDCLQIQSLDNGQLHREENSPQIDNETKFANPKTSKAIEEGTTLGNHSESFVSDKCSTSFNFPLVVSSSPCGFIKDSGKGHQVVSEILHDNCQNSLSRIEGFGERRSITLPGGSLLNMILSHLIVAKLKPHKPIFYLTRYMLLKMLRSTGIHFGSHSPRRGVATYFASKCHSLNSIRKILGHKNVNVTRLYIQPHWKQPEARKMIRLTRCLDI